MLLSRAVEVALLTLPHLDPRGPGAPGAQIRTLAQRSGVPAPYLAKVLQELARKGLLRGKRGRGGGFVLGRAAAEITLQDVVLALEGKETLDAAIPPMAGPAGARLEPVRRRLLEILAGTTLADLRVGVRA